MKIELNSSAAKLIHELVVTEGNAVIKEDIGTYDGLIPLEYPNDMLYIVNQMYYINYPFNSDVDFVAWVARKYLNKEELEQLKEEL